MSFLGRTYRTLQVLHHMRQQREIPFLPQAELEALQQERLRTIISHAYHTVPYYRSTMDQLGLTPSDFRSARDLAKLPLLSKEQVFRRPNLFRSAAIDPSYCLAFKSSGTSGAGAAILYDPHAVLFNLACAGREIEVITRHLGKPFVLSRVAAIVTPPYASWAMQRFYETQTLLSTRWLLLSTLDPLERNVALINRFQPHILRGYGSYLSVVFQLA